MQQNDLSGLDLVVPDDLAGQRLDRALASVTGLSRTRIQEAIKGGGAQVDGKPARASQILEAGQRVTMAGEAAMVASATAGEAPAADAIPLRILYEDDYLLVVDKPAGMVTHPAPGHRRARWSMRCWPTRQRSPASEIARVPASSTGWTRIRLDCWSWRKTPRRTPRWRSR